MRRQVALEEGVDRAAGRELAGELLARDLLAGVAGQRVAPGHAARALRRDLAGQFARQRLAQRGEDLRSAGGRQLRQHAAHRLGGLRCGSGELAGDLAGRRQHLAPHGIVDRRELRRQLGQQGLHALDRRRLAGQELPQRVEARSERVISCGSTGHGRPERDFADHRAQQGQQRRIGPGQQPGLFAARGEGGRRRQAQIADVGVPACGVVGQHQALHLGDQCRLRRWRRRIRGAGRSGGC
jgi:hypothetical protein